MFSPFCLFFDWFRPACAGFSRADQKRASHKPQKLSMGS